MEIVIGLISGIFIGFMVGRSIANAKSRVEVQSAKDDAKRAYNEIEIAYEKHKATSDERLKAFEKRDRDTENEIVSLKMDLLEREKQSASISGELAMARANYSAASKTIEEKNRDIVKSNEDLESLKTDFQKNNRDFAIAEAYNEALKEKLETQKAEIEEIGNKFNAEFENIANKIFETKTEKFTQLNKTNMKTILDPLGQNIEDFKKQVNDVYSSESKERFSLGEKVKELAKLNQVISEEARNLTRALKGEAKTQGCWGEMILESILERSGLRKNEQYFMEMELKDEKGNALKSDSEGKKMRPDAVIKYPDSRNVIIDSKVSLNAYTRYNTAEDADVQKLELDAHVRAIRNHIVSLSTKGYDDYDKSLDFVMMFVPSEPAYIAALEGDPELWNFAYDKRILLINPTNLITTLKIIVDLWKREYQNRNALEIADRGAKLYDKFVGFVDNLELVGKSIDKAQDRYQDAYKQLYTGNDNLVRQTTKLKELGLKTKKELPEGLVNYSENRERPLRVAESAE
ncbi:MAG: DNA recombination protein RmuC [Peptostreptococcaceae bacterium]|nr:DNA recombination protein RmuC [Peptostreptococcaceae bacterium]